MRNFVYKRSLNGAHQNIAARFPALIPNSAVSPSAAAQSSDLITSLTQSVAQPSTTNIATTPTTSIPSPTPSSSASTAPSPSSSSPSLSSSSPSSSSSSSSSSTRPSSSSSALASTVASASAATPSNVSPVTSFNLPSASTQVVTSFTPSSPSTTSATPSNHSASGTSTGTIIGGVAGSLAGIIILGLLLMWCMRRQRNRDIDDFDAQAFKRQSAILVDDPVEPPQSYNPRPPTMIERHNASPALAAQTGYGGQNFYGNYAGFGQQSPYPPPEMMQPSTTLPEQAYAPMGYSGYDDPRQQVVRQPSNVGFADYDTRQQVGRQPSSGKYLTRQPTAAAGYVPPSVPANPVDSHYIDLNRSSVSPYQAAQYADISRQLGTSNPDEHVPQQSHELPDDPLPSPFDDPPQANPAVQTSQAPYGRPDTLYEEGDAYGGI